MLKIKYLNVSDLVKKTGNNSKITELEKKITDHDHDKSITTQKFHKLASEKFASRITKADLA